MYLLFCFFFAQAQLGDETRKRLALVALLAPAPTAAMPRTAPLRASTHG